MTARVILYYTAECEKCDWISDLYESKIGLLGLDSANAKRRANREADEHNKGEHGQ